MLSQASPAIKPTLILPQAWSTLLGKVIQAAKISSQQAAINSSEMHEAEVIRSSPGQHMRTA